MTKLKVAIVSTGSGNIRRGFEIFADELFNHLKTKIDITLFKGGGKGGKKEIVIPNIGRDSALLGGKNSFLKYNKRYRIEQATFSIPLICHLINGKYDVIHLMDPSLCRIIFNLKEVWKSSPRLIITNGGPFSPNRYKRYDFTHQLTPFYYEGAIRAGVSREKMAVIPIPVDTAMFSHAPQSTFRENFGIPEDVFLIVSVGAMNKYHKRMHWLINEVAKLKGEAYLLIVGEVEDETPRIKSLGREKLSNNIKFLTLTHREMPQVYKAADLFVLASTVEAFGMVFLEAMASGLPIIAHDHPNQRWILGHTGTFVNMEKENELAENITEFMADKEKAKRLGEKGRERAERIFSWNVLAQKYIEMYEKVS